MSDDPSQGINRDKVEAERIYALEGRDARKYFLACNELGVPAEDPILYEQGSELFEMQSYDQPPSPTDSSPNGQRFGEAREFTQAVATTIRQNPAGYHLRVDTPSNSAGRETLYTRVVSLVRDGQEETPIIVYQDPDNLSHDPVTTRERLDLRREGEELLDFMRRDLKNRGLHFEGGNSGLELRIAG